MMGKIRDMQDDFGSPLHSPRPRAPRTPVAPVEKGTVSQQGRWRILSGYGAAYLGQQDGEPRFGHNLEQQKTYKSEAAAKAAITKYDLEGCFPELID